MRKIEKDILNCLNEIKSGGKFVTDHTADFVFPGLTVEGAGEMAYPINEMLAKSIISVAHKAPFGKGMETVFDNKVRSAWEINANKLSFEGNEWDEFLKKILNTIKPELGLGGYNISAHLYKMLVYEKGDFFLPHRDTEKEKGMFGTLIIGLPSKHTGGELIVRFDGLEKTVSFSKDSRNNKIPYTAFYADCEHEIKPITSGYRFCLVYNLIQKKEAKNIQLQSTGAIAEKLSQLLKDEAGKRAARPLIVLLGHQYTPENFSKGTLKLKDRAKADLLLRAAANAGYYAKLCLVTSCLTGSPAYGGYDDDDIENAEMEEVFDEWIAIEHWANDDLPPLHKILVEEDHLIVSFKLKDGEPVIKESGAYMGNYGPDLSHWYHYGALVLWSRQVHTDFLPLQDAANQLRWIDYYNKHQDILTSKEIAVVENILYTGIGPITDDDKKDKPDYNAIANWVINRKEEKFFSRLEPQQLQLYFRKIDTAHWEKLIDFLPAATISTIFTAVVPNGGLGVIARLLSILRALTENSKSVSLIAQQMKEIPAYLTMTFAKHSKTDFSVNNAVLRDLLYLESKMPQDEVWINKTVAVITACKERKYIHNILAAEVLLLKKKTALADKILITCKQYLQHNADRQPKPPADWSRSMPGKGMHAAQWQLLKAFLASPVEQIFEYKKGESLRKELEKAISHADVDLKTETIKKGTPYTLRISKTQASYNRAMKEWNEDVALLKKLLKIE